MNRRSAVACVAELLDETLSLFEDLQERRGEAMGLSTGLLDLDEKLSGLKPSNLVIIGARPAVGKTALAVGMATNVAVYLGRPVLYFSFEMSHLELTQRVVCADARVDAERVRKGQLRDGDWERIAATMGRLATAPLYIDDSPHLTAMEVQGRARRLQARVGPLGLVIVDYLQLMTGRRSAENRQVEVAEMSRGLKLLARELNAPVVALSQLSRNLETRQDKRPMLADLRESGALENDADVVLLLHREELFKLDPAQQGVAEVIVAKHRNGPTGSVELTFLKHQARFANTALDV